MKSYSILLSPGSWNQKIIPYLNEIKGGGRVGHFLSQRFQALDGLKTELSAEGLLCELLNTKRPQIFAESAIAGDGSDWNQTELSILGDVSMALPVTIYDNGRHRDPDVHTEPFAGTLLFTPGALLCNGRGLPPCDMAEVTRDGRLDPTGYYRLYKRRLLPPLLYANAVCQAAGTEAFITLPGLGCGVFAGPFKGELGQLLNKTVRAILENHIDKLTHIRALYYDPYSEAQNERHEIGHLSYMVRPLLQGNETKPQLCRPIAYQEPGDDFSECQFFSFVAWDHVSWPGNDYWVGSRATDDGVKGAATDTMRAMTGIEGKYDLIQGIYRPPGHFSNWNEVVSFYGLELELLELMIE